MSAKQRLRTTTILSSAAGGLWLAVSGAQAADVYKAPVLAQDPSGPAVDGLNAKIDGLGGSFAGKTIYAARGSLAAPLGTSFGVQIDGAAGNFDDRFFAAGAGHLFWRDPSRMLLGLYASHSYLDRDGGVNLTQVGGESEYYFARWSLHAVAGVEFGDSVSQVVGGQIETFDVRTRFFDTVDVAYYLQDNFKISVGHRYLGGRHALALGGEYGIALSGATMAALFVEGRVGENDNHGVWGGVRFYFGQHQKTLLQRHRQDDPLDWAPDGLFSITNSGSTTPVPVSAPPSGDGI